MTQAKIGKTSFIGQKLTVLADTAMQISIANFNFQKVLHRKLRQETNFSAVQLCCILML